MNRFNKFVSLVVLFCFLVNTVISNCASAQNLNNYKLAVSSNFDDLTGLQKQDMGRIEAVLRLNFAQAGYRDILDIDKLIQIADDYRDSAYQTQIMFRNPKVLSNDHVAVLCKTRENDSVDGAVRYYAVFSKNAKDFSSPVYVYTEEEFDRFAKSGSFNAEPPKRTAGTAGDKENAKEIAQYVKNGAIAWNALKAAIFSAKGAFPVKLAETRSRGVDISRQSGNLKVLAEYSTFFSLPEGIVDTQIDAVKQPSKDDTDSQITLELFKQSIVSFLSDLNTTSESMPGLQKVFTNFLGDQAAKKELAIQIVSDNDRLVDFANIGKDILNPRMGLRIDVELVRQLGISLNEKEKFNAETPSLLRGAQILSAMSFIYQIYLMEGKSDREASHAIINYYLTLTEKDRAALIETLRTEKIDSGNIFNIFLAGLTDIKLVKEIEDFDITPYVNLTSNQLKHKQAKIQQELLSGELETSRREDLESQADAIEKTMLWRDKQVSWLMLFKNIDMPFDYARVSSIMKEGFDRQEKGELNVDEWQIKLHEAIAGTLNPDIEDANIFNTAKWLNQHGIRNVVGRLGRAFENQARMVSCAMYVVVQKEMRDMALALRSSTKDIENMRIPLQKLVLLITQKTEPSLVELDVALQKCETALLEYQQEQKQKLVDQKRDYVSTMTRIPSRLEWYDKQIENVDKEVGNRLADLSEIRAKLDEAKKKDAAFVFLIQRLIPQESHKLAKAVTFRDVDQGKEEDIRDLLRRGGHRAYCTPGQGKSFNVLMFADDIIEAIPMLVKERIIEETRPDGTVVRVTQAEVDQKGMEVFFRNVFAPNFLRNIRNRMDTQVVNLAREILFNTNKYRPFYEQYKELDFSEFMQAMATVKGFEEDVVGLAAVIDQSYSNLLEQVLEYQKKESVDRISAIKAIILGNSIDTSRQNIAAKVLSDIEGDVVISEAIASNVEYAKKSHPAFEKRLSRIAPYWDWKARRMPTLHDLTTQAPGLTEAYIETWVEEEMTLINILEDMPEQAEKMKELGATFRQNVLKCTRQVLKEYGMEPLVQEVYLNNRCRNEDDAVMQMLMVYPFVADEVAKLLMLSEYNQADDNRLNAFIAKHANDIDFLKEAVDKTISLNGLTLKNQIAEYQEQRDCDKLTAAIAVIKADTSFDNDFENNKKFCARTLMLEELDKESPADKIKDRTKAFVRNYTALGISTARKETIAMHHLQHLMLSPKYHYSAEGLKKMFNLLYTPSRVNLGYKELWSIMGWGQAVGAKGTEAAAAGYDFYRLINREPVVYNSPRIAEALKTLENGYKSANYGIANAFAIYISYLGRGDIQRLVYEMNSRGDRRVEYPGEGYGGYCVPKDGLFNVFVVKLTQKDKLRDMGVDPRFYEDIINLAKKLLAERVRFDNEFDWETYAAKELMQYEKLKEYVRVEDEQPILIFNITNLAKIIEDIGRPDATISNGDSLLLNLLSEWGLEPVITQNERINRMMPFFKAWMILKNHPKKVNLTAEYKAITGEENNVGDVRFASGIRIFEILAGCCDHLIRQFDDEGQNLARLLRFGFDPENKDPELKNAALWFMEKSKISHNDTETIERLKDEMRGFEPPEDIAMTATSGVAVGDIFKYTSDRQVSPEDIAVAVQQFIADLGLSDKQMAAASDVFGATITDWPKLRDIPELKKHLDSKIDVRGLDGKTYSYKLKSAIHYLALRQRTIARSYESGLQGCDTVNLGVVSGALEKFVRQNMPMLVKLMLNGQPDEEPKLIDGSPGRSDPALRTYTDTDIKLFFAVCEAVEKHGIYNAPGFGVNDGVMLRNTMHLHRERGAQLLAALDKIADSDENDVINNIKKAEQILVAIESGIDQNNEATKSLQDEEMYSSWDKLLPRDSWLSVCLSNLAGGMPLSTLDFGTWLAMGGMYVVAGKSAQDIENIKEKFNKAIAATQEIGPQITAQYSDLMLSKEESEDCASTLIMSKYEPEVGEFTQQQLVEISSKAVEASATLARERRKALEKRAAVARARRLTTEEYGNVQRSLSDKARDQKDMGSFLEESIASCKDSLSTVLTKSQAVSTGERTQDNLDALNKGYGSLSAHMKAVFDIIIDRYAGKYAPKNDAKDRDIQKQLKMDLNDIFSINGFNVEAIKEFLGGYESIGGIALIAQAASNSENASRELNLVTEAVEYFYSLYAIAQTIEHLQITKEDVDLRMLWDNITVFFAETINDHFYEYIPWAYSKGTGYQTFSKEELYALCAKHHKWLYKYLRGIMVNITGISDLPEDEQNILLGNVSESGEVTNAAGCDYERNPDGAELNPGESFWRAYNQLREVTFILNDGLAAMEIMKENPDLKKKDFRPNTKYPTPIVFDNFDPSLIDADNRVNMAFLFPVGRTHVSKLIRSAASVNAKRIAEGKLGLNAIITRFAPIVEVDGQKVVVLKDGHFYMSRDEFKEALRVCKGYSEEAADLYIVDLEQQGSFVDGRIRVVAKFSRPVISTSVVPFHHMPTFDNGALEDAGIPATCQSLYTEWITYDKSCYDEMLQGTDVELPAEIRWLEDWNEQFDNSDEEIIKVLIGGSESSDKIIKNSKNETVEFKGLRKFAQGFIDQDIEPVIIVKGASESGARGQKVFLLTTEESLKEAAEFIFTVSRAPQNVVIQRVIRINPEFWASEELMNEFVDRRIIERGSPVTRTKYPRTPYFCSFRVVPSSSNPDETYDNTSHIMVMNTEIATNVGRGGSLEPLINRWIHTNYQNIIQDILNDNSEAFMQAINNSAPKFAERFEKIYGRKIGKDILGTPYSWMPLALLDWLAEPVFEKEGKIVDIEPVYKNGKQVGSKVILQDRNGKRFEGKIKPGKDGWRVYMIEPNTGIGQIDRRTLRMEELEVKRAAKDNNPVDWDAIESEDHIILNNWADRGGDYGAALFGKDFFRPSPALNPNSAIVVVTPEDYARSKSSAVSEFKPSGEYADILKKAYNTTRKALDLTGEDSIDNVSLSVLLKYCFVESIKNNSSLDINEIRKNMSSGKWSIADLDAFIAPFMAATEYTAAIENSFKQMCRKELNMTQDELHKVLYSDEYMPKIWGLVRAHLISEWTCPEVEIMPGTMKVSDVRKMMGDKKHLLAHTHLDNPIAANETFALISDSEGSDMGVISIDVSRRILEGNSSSHILAYVKLPGQNKMRLVKFDMEEPMQFDAIWRDETCPEISSDIPQINPGDVSNIAQDKARTLRVLATRGIAVPEFLLLQHNDGVEHIRNRLSEWVGTLMAIKGNRPIAIYVSPNDSTQSIGTRRFIVNEGQSIDEIAKYIKQLGEDVIVRRSVGNVIYRAGDASERTIDMRFNVAYTGEGYEVVSESMLVSDKSDAETASVRMGGTFIAPQDGYMNIYTSEGGNIILTNEQLKDIRIQVAKALEGLNDSRPETEWLLFAGVDARLQFENDQEVTAVIIEINSQAAGLSHSYSLTNRKRDESGFETTEPQVATPGFWQYLAQKIRAENTKPINENIQPKDRAERTHSIAKPAAVHVPDLSRAEKPRATNAVKASLPNDHLKKMKNMVEAIASEGFDVRAYPPGWNTISVENQKMFFRLLYTDLQDKPEALRALMVNNYLNWLMDKVFPDIQKEKRNGYKNRLYPNEVAEYITSHLIYNAPSPASTQFLRTIDGRLPELLVKIVDNNLDMCHRFFTDMAIDQSHLDAVAALDTYIKTHMQKSGTKKAKAQTACAISSDIVRTYLKKEEEAKTYDTMISQINRELYAQRKAQLLKQVFGDNPRPTPMLVENGEDKVFVGTCPNRKCDSSACGSDALYALHLDPDGGMAVNYPVLFAEGRELDTHMPVATARRIEENKIALRAISNMATERSQDAVITVSNIEDLFSVKNGKVFTDTGDPLYFLKYALFFSGIIGSGINKLTLIQESLEKAKEDPMFLAQAYYDSLTGEREQVAEAILDDISKFTRGGGIEIICDNHLAPLAAGFSSSSSASISTLRALYAMGGQNELLDPQVSADIALIFENDMGRGTGDQDTTGTLEGIKNITYRVQDCIIIRDIENIALSRDIIEEMEKRTVIFVPGIPRAASAGIGARQNAYLLREPNAFEAIQLAKEQHRQTLEALRAGDFTRLGQLQWEYTENRAKIHADALPDEMRTLFNWLLGKEALTIGGKVFAPRVEKPLILGGELAGSMGVGSSASLIASDFGLKKADSEHTKLELALGAAMKNAPYFKNAYLRYLQTSDKGPGSVTLKGVADETPDNIDREIQDTTALADKAGREIPTYIDARYTLLFFNEFFADGEFNAQNAIYGDKFDFGNKKINISGLAYGQYIDAVIVRAKEREDKTIALVSHKTPKKLLSKLTALGIRFIPTNIQNLVEMRAKNDEYREQFQRETYSTMWLARHINDATLKNSAAYRVLTFYLKTHFALDNIGTEEYVEAILAGNVAKLIQGYLMYRPAMPYNARKDYENIAPTLLSA